MISYNELRKGNQIIIDGEPYEVLEAMSLKKAQRRVIIQTKIKNLINGNMISRNFHQGDIFEEADLVKFAVKFIYCHKDRFFFSYLNDSSNRFDLDEKQIGAASKFLKQGEEVEAIKFQDKIIAISLPIKVQLKIKETSPGVKGERAQPGTKTAELETGATINVPLFINEGDIIELNTETGGYTRRIE
ncbi:MAG: elongation factor P [Candidatus Parcubacteria bacterium]|nr:elongation factor P [Candidatus Parcubacteria bacterium]